jgi:X-X-X-Leu-X-X-Gly heptad repeat protein
MATTNYSLPTLESTALFDLVTDYNALANATDAALASVAGLIPSETITEMEGQISALQTLTGSQGTQITTLQSQMSTANGNISTLQSGLVTANNNIGKLQTGLQTTNKNVQSANNAIQALQAMMSPIIVLSGLNASSSNCTVAGNVFCHPAAKILIFSMNAAITYNFTNSSSPKIPSFSQVLPSDYLPTQDKRIFVGSAMSGDAACNLQLDISSETGAITPVINGIKNVQSFKINGNAMLMYDIPADANNS